MEIYIAAFLMIAGFICLIKSIETAFDLEKREKELEEERRFLSIQRQIHDVERQKC